ncbi:Tethering factor for nuclear proteasome sts1 [Thoreauomyces humboldtii]|nr:Tethering factor for nuclear proteasome sts1 [Thoreauomyces humboldtii]
MEPEVLVRLQEAPATLPQPPIRKLLSMLPSDQLAGIICSMLETNAHLQTDLVALIPRPSLTTAAALLERAEKAVIDAFPYSKNGRSTTAYSFHRVRPHLDELRDLLLYFVDFFVLPGVYPADLQHEYPAIAFGYLDAATRLVHRLPRWEDPAQDDQTRGQLYRRLGQAWRVAVAEVARRTREGKIFGSTPVSAWAENLHQHTNQTNGEYGFREAFNEFKESLGWVIGIDVRPNAPQLPPGPALSV